MDIYKTFEHKSLVLSTKTKWHEYQPIQTIKQKSIPYEAYYFSSNMDHYIHHEANPKFNKAQMAEEFGFHISEKDFISYFCDDPDALGHLGYQESWDEIRKENQSVCRHTNLDYLIRSLLE